MAYYATRGIHAAIQQNPEYANELLLLCDRYSRGDWGELCESDKDINRNAIVYGGRILAAYPTTQGRVYIITDDTKAKKPVTTVLFADEY